jgi:hypothetical protein
MSDLLALQPALCQFLIYGPTPGTPFYEQVMKEGRLHEEMTDDRALYYRNCTGFKAMVNHPTMSPGEIEAAQKRCFAEDLRRLGPSMFRSLETWLLGYERLKDSGNPMLRLKAKRFANEIRRAYPIFLAGKVLGQDAGIRRRIVELESKVHAALGAPTLGEGISSAAALGLAAWTGASLKFGIGQHPRLTRHTFRVPEESLPSKVWRRLRGEDAAGHQVEVELRPESTVWVTVAGTLSVAGAERLAAGIGDALTKRKERLVLDLERLAQTERQALEDLGQRLRDYRDRIRVVVPNAEEFAGIALLFAMYR